MRRALQLASLGEGETSPNPLVGAVVLDKEGHILGEGFHSRAGSPHAEIEAFAQAGNNAKGGTLIVTLEPCCHHGLTPPCTEAILKSQVQRVVVASNDPDKRVSGKGISILKKAGLEVINGILKKEADYQNRAFRFRVKTGRPWGVLKWAMSLDGRTSLSNGESKWISSSKAREYVHQMRANSDAVIVGGGTVRMDDPLLTSRGIANSEPLRVVFTKSLNLPQQAKLWDTSVASTFIAYSSIAERNHLDQFPDGPQRIVLNKSEPIELLEALARKGCNRVLWECGPRLGSAAISSGCVQELAVVISPKLLGGEPFGTPLASLGFKSMEEVILLNQVLLKRIDQDWLMHMCIPQFQN